MPSEIEVDIAVMLNCDCDEIPSDLLSRVFNVDGLCRSAGGRLQSCQVIAMIVEQWRRECPAR